MSARNAESERRIRRLVGLDCDSLSRARLGRVASAFGRIFQTQLVQPARVGSQVRLRARRQTVRRGYSIEGRVGLSRPLAAARNRKGAKRGIPARGGSASRGDGAVHVANAVERLVRYARRAARGGRRRARIPDMNPPSRRALFHVGRVLFPYVSRFHQRVVLGVRQF